MKLKFQHLLLVFLLLSLSIVYAQDTNTVKYSLFLEKSVTFGTVDTKITEGEFKEGKSFIIPQSELPSSPIDFSMYQDLYNALVGGVFGVDYGALDNDIEMKFFIRSLNPNQGTYLNLGTSSDTLFSYFEIRIWELPDSNFYPEDSSYYFNEGYHSHFTLPKSDYLKTFLTLTGIGLDDSLAFAYLEPNKDGQDDWNSSGIKTIETEDSVKFEAIHLSRIGGGKRKIANSTLTDIKSLEKPLNFELFQNYPNPFNPSTLIRYSLNKTSSVKLEVYDILGKKVSTLINKTQPAGKYSTEFSSKNSDYMLSSGIYFYLLRVDGFTLKKKMILMK